MSLLNGYLSLVIKFFSSDLCVYFLYPFFALFFVVSVPCIFHRIFSWHS